MTDASDPLLPRVMVNRVWHHLFGRGIVASVDDFGVLGQPPSTPNCSTTWPGGSCGKGGRSRS